MYSAYKFFIGLGLLFASTGTVCSQVINLYGSKQTSEFTKYEGDTTITTDKYTSGDVTLTATGCLGYTVSPTTLSIDTNSTETWTGEIYPIIGSMPEPGNQVSESITGDYTVRYSRPVGVGSGGTVISTHQCYPDSANPCGHHGTTSGDHEIVEKTDDEERYFNIYSVNVTVPEENPLCDTNTTTITASGYPSGGTYQWTTSNSDLTLTNETTATVTVEYTGSDADNLDAYVKVLYDKDSVTYADSGNVHNKEDFNIQKDFTDVKLGPGTQAAYSITLECGKWDMVDKTEWKRSTNTSWEETDNYTFRRWSPFPRSLTITVTAKVTWIDGTSTEKTTTIRYDFFRNQGDDNSGDGGGGIRG